MRAIFVCVLGVAMVLAARSAQASCERSEAHFSPFDGTALPTRGTTYLFAVNRANRTYTPITAEEAISSLSVKGASFSARVIASTSTRYVIRIDYFAEGSSITLSWRASSSTHPIFAPSSENHACVIGMEHLNSRTICPSFNAIDVSLRSNAIAYRLEWDDDTATVVTSRPAWREEGLDETRNDFSLGRVDCNEDDVSIEAFATLRSFRLFALFADGTEQPFPRPAFASRTREHARLPTELESTCSIAPPPPTENRPLPPKPPASTHLAALSVLAALFALLISLLLGTFLLRRSTPTSPPRP